MTGIKRVIQWAMVFGLWALTYAAKVGRQVDVVSNVIFLDGEENETVSLHAARAEAAGKPWGCVLCRALAVLVQPNHCKDVLATGYVATGFVYFRAGTAFALVYFVLYLLVRFVAGLI